MNNYLQLINIEKKFVQGSSELVILDKANLSIKKGEIVALVGPSGSGKSTLLHIAGLLDQVDGGQVIIDSKDYSEANDSERTNARRHHIGFVYQFHHLLPEFTALENIMIAQMLIGVSKKIATEHAMEFLEKLGLAKRAVHFPSELSGGEQQRIAIARALVNQPDLLLADEPTGNLDPATAEYVFALLLEVTRKLGLTALIATHNMQIASRMSRSVTMQNGKIQEVTI
jgi:lipoprotein-releasing system ATP-binding protein